MVPGAVSYADPLVTSSETMNRSVGVGDEEPMRPFEGNNWMDGIYLPFERIPSVGV